MFGQEPGKERHIGVMNQHVVTKVDAPTVAYFVMHTRGENPTSVLIAALTKHYQTANPTKSAGEVNDWVMDLVVATTDMRFYRTAAEFDRVKDTEISAPGRDVTETLDTVVKRSTGSCVLGVMKKDTANGQ